MAVYAGQGRKPFSAAQLLAMEEERKKRLAEAKANQAIMLEKDRTWRDKLAGRKSIQGQYWEAYPESAPRGFWGDLVYRHGATSNLFGAPEMQMGNAGIWALDNIKKQEAARNSQPNWSPSVGPNYNPIVEEDIMPPVLREEPIYKQLSDEDFARTYAEQRRLGQPIWNIPNYTTGTPIGDWLAGQGKRAYQYSELGKVDGQTPYQWAETQLDEIEANRRASQPEVIEAKKIAAEREAAVKAAEEQRVNDALAQIDALNELEYGEDKSVQMTRQGIFDESMLGTGVEPRNIFNESTEEIINNEALAVEPAVVQQVEEDSLLEADSFMDSITFESAGLLSDLRPGEENTWANMVKPYKELYSGIKDYYVNATPESIMDDITDWFMQDVHAVRDTWNDPENQQANIEFSNKWLERFTEVDEAAQESWERIWAKALGVSEDSDGKEELNREEVKDLTNSAVVLMDESTKNSNSVENLLGDGTASSKKGVAKNLFEATTGSSTEGFTMDRLKNPLSPENKAWWLEKREGDIPGNNRAVEFFNTLAYIGTPLKYRPAKTPSETLQERKIQHLNNQLDYAASQTSTAPTFASLRAAVPSHQVIEDTIRGEVEAGADKGFLFGLFGGDDKDDIDNMIAEKATIIREKMLQMTLANNVIPSIQEAIDALSPPTTTAPPPPPEEGDGVIAKGVNWFSGLF